MAHYNEHFLSMWTNIECVGGLIFFYQLRRLASPSFNKTFLIDKHRLNQIKTLVLLYPRFSNLLGLCMYSILCLTHISHAVYSSMSLPSSFAACLSETAVNYSQELRLHQETD